MKLGAIGRALFNLSCYSSRQGSPPTGCCRGGTRRGSFQASADPSKAYLPLMLEGVMLDGSTNVPRVNAPSSAARSLMDRWRLPGSAGSTPPELRDIRTGYNESELYVNLSVFDRRLCTTPRPPVIR